MLLTKKQHNLRWFFSWESSHHWLQSDAWLTKDIFGKENYSKRAGITLSQRTQKFEAIYRDNISLLTKKQCRRSASFSSSTTPRDHMHACITAICNCSFPILSCCYTTCNATGSQRRFKTYWNYFIFTWRAWLFIEVYFKTKGLLIWSGENERKRPNYWKTSSN